MKALCKKEPSGSYCIYDIPTCLNASYIAITLDTGKDFLGETQNFSLYAQREIHNFVNAAFAAEQQSGFLPGGNRLVLRLSPGTFRDQACSKHGGDRQASAFNGILAP